MSEADANLLESAHCPFCEYDLRANTSGRCPECGSFVGSGSLSRLPWIYRHARGGIRAYAQMLTLLLLTPWKLNAEKTRRVWRQPAARFHHESIALATTFGAGLLAIAFLLRGPHWDDLVNPNLAALLANSPTRALLWLPIVIWNDQLVMLIPLVPTVYVGLHLSAWFYRRMLRLTHGSTTPHARRASRIGFYASGLAPVLAVLLGILFILSILVYEELDLYFAGWRPLIRELRLFFALSTIALFCYPTAFLLFHDNRRKMRSTFLALTLYPLLQLAAWGIIGLSLFWILGYCTLALWSMTH